MNTKTKTAAQVSRPAKSIPSHSGATSAGWTVLHGLCALLLVFSAHGNTLTWSGSGAPSNANWNDIANWGGVGIPGNGDTIIFSGSHTNAFVNTNNIANLSLNQIQFVGDNTFGVMFDLRGNAFTLTGSILATNVTGTNVIENNITLPNTSELIVVSNSDQLIIEGVLSGPGGVTKAGAGTLTYQCAGDNTYTGTTLVNGGVLQFNVSGEDAVSGPLVIGDGTGDYDATVQDLQGFEMDSGPSVAINENGELNLNNFSEPYFTTNLTISYGTLETGSGTLALLPNPTFTIDGYPTIAGNLYLNGGTLTLQGGGMVYFVANLSGTGNILQTGGASTVWYGVNTYSGNFTAQGGGFVNLGNSQALGNTNNTLTLDDNAEVIIQGVNYNITNQSLTINSTSYPAILSDPQTHSWTGSFIFNTSVTIDVFTNAVFTLNGPISGAGSVTKTDSGQLAYTGTTANTYSGATTVDGGTLQLGKSSTVPAIPGALFIGTNATVRLLNNFQINNPYVSVTLSNSSLFDLAGYDEWVGPISLQGAQITSGAGLLYLNGNITVNPSTVALSIIGGNVILWNGGYVVTNTGHSASPDLVISANISSGEAGYGLTKDGPGEVNLTGNNTFDGPVTINNGGLWAGNATALGTTNFPATVNSNGTLYLAGNGFNFGVKPLVMNGSGWSSYINFGLEGAVLCNGSSFWAGNVTLAGDTAAYTYDASTLTLAGPIGGAGGWQVYGPGTNVFSGSLSNSYAGTTTVNSGTLLLDKGVDLSAVPGNLVIDSAGTVRLENSQQTANTADVLVNSGGLFDLATSSTFINTLHGTGTVNFGTDGWILVGYNNGSSEFDGSFTGIGYAPGFTVGKYGTGTFTIGGDSSYTAGITHDYFGELVINGYQAAISVTVDAGTTLGGSGFVYEITANGTVEPGTPGLGTGTLISGDVTFSAAANFAVQLTGTNTFGFSSSDQLYAIGPVGTNFLNNATLTVVPIFTQPLAVGQQFVILNGQGTGLPLISDVISGTFKGLPNGATFNVDGVGFQISYSTYQVVLKVTSLPAKPVITGIQPAAGGGFQLTGMGGTNLTYSVWASTNLTTTNWVTIGSVTVPAITNVFQFTDTNTMYYADRFYRFTWP